MTYVLFAKCMDTLEHTRFLVSPMHSHVRMVAAHVLPHGQIADRHTRSRCWLRTTRLAVQNGVDHFPTSVSRLTAGRCHTLVMLPFASREPGLNLTLHIERFPRSFFSYVRRPQDVAVHPEQQRVDLLPSRCTYPRVERSTANPTHRANRSASSLPGQASHAPPSGRDASCPSAIWLVTHQRGQESFSDPRLVHKT